jgi:hypothetical protein
MNAVLSSLYKKILFGNIGPKYQGIFWFYPK